MLTNVSLCRPPPQPPARQGGERVGARQKIAEEARLDGIYVLRTSLPEEVLGPDGVVFSYKELEAVERAFGGFGPELDVRPIRHRLADRARAHVFLRMLSYYVAWHMKEALAPLLFKDDDKEAALAARPGPVAPAVRSAKALKKRARKRTDDGWPAHSFETLLKDLGTICVNTIEPTDRSVPPFKKVTLPTPLQRRAFELLGVSYRLGYAA